MTNELSDAELLALIQRGDQSALEIVINRYSFNVFRTVNYRLNDVQASEEIVASTFFQLWRQRRKLVLKESKSLFPWLHVVARNLVFEQLRINTKYVFASLEQVVDDETISNDSTLDDFRFEVLGRALQVMSVSERELVLLRYIDNLSYDEIAKLVDCSTGAARTRVSRSLAKLRNFYDVELELEVTRNAN